MNIPMRAKAIKKYSKLYFVNSTFFLDRENILDLSR